MTALSGFPIARPTGVCAATGVKFAAGDPFIAGLFERDDGQLERLDYSPGAWSKAQGKLFGSWRGVMPAPDAKPKLQLDDQELLDLFEQLSSADAKKAGFRYVLGLLLVRRRVLRYEGTATVRGRAVMRVRHATAGGGEPGPVIEVDDPGLDQSAIAEVIEQLGEVISPPPAV